MQQYFLKHPITLHTPILLDQEAFHHISHVLRMKEHDIIRICDETAMYYARIHFADHAVYATAYEEIEDHTKTKIPITLAQGLIKGDKWDLVIQKACELGVTRIIPFTSSRCVVKAKQEKLDRKLERWNKIAKEACEQCKRSTVAPVLDVMKLNELHQQTNANTLKLIAYEDADIKGHHFKTLLSKYPNCSDIFIVIGPEGGFSKEEVDLLIHEGFYAISLGARILRAETAAFYTLSTLSFYYEEV